MQLKYDENQATRVILLRHGQSTFNVLGLYQGSSDASVLTEVGRKEARITGDFLKGFSFDAVYISSLQRAQETAKEILNVITVNPKAVFVTDKLWENHLPHWEGLAFQYVRETFPEAYQTWKQHPDEFWMQIDSNTLFYPALNLYQRVYEFWQEILPLHVGKTLLIVAHGGTNRALICTALGISPKYYHCFQQSNCGISVLNFYDGLLVGGELEVMNWNCHLSLVRGGEERIF